MYEQRNTFASVSLLQWRNFLFMHNMMQTNCGSVFKGWSRHSYLADSCGFLDFSPNCSSQHVHYTWE